MVAAARQNDVESLRFHLMSRLLSEPKILFGNPFETRFSIVGNESRNLTTIDSVSTSM